MIKSIAIAFIALFTAIPAWAEAPSLKLQNKVTVNDFAYEATLSNAVSSLRQTVLPFSIYKHLSRRDYGDLRVFNNDNQIVPHQFIQVATPADTLQTRNLQFFPFSKKQASNPNNIRVVIKQSVGQHQLEINQPLKQSPSTNVDKEQNEFQYIIVNEQGSNAKQKLCKLTLDWNQTKPSMILPLRLESSDDLQNWQSISRSLNVSKLDFSGSQLLNDALNLPCTMKKYLRLTWLKPQQKNYINTISGSYSQQAKQITETVTLDKPYYDVKGDLLFENNLNIALSSMEFVSLEESVLIKGKLYSRNHESSPWQFHKNIMQYRLAIAETQLNSRPFTLSNIRDRYWKLDLANEAQLSANQLPEIRGRWQQIKLTYLAQGNGPFRLAYGNPMITPADNTGLSQLIESIKDAGVRLDQVTVSNPHKVRELAKIEKPMPWKKIGLWVFLLIGIAVLAYMALSLYRQMNENKE